MKKFFLALLVTLVFSFAVWFPGSTLAEGTQAQIDALIAQIVQLQQVLSALIMAKNGGNCANLTKTLALGSSGTQVTKLQNFLKQQGDFKSTANGQFGPVTEIAVRKFQARKGLVSSGPNWGVVGSATRAKIKAISCPYGVPPDPFTPPTPETPAPLPDVPLVPGALSISCAGFPVSVGIGQTVTWTASATGGTPPYTYSWSGTESLSGSVISVTKTYASLGVKTASVTVNGTVHACGNNVEVVTDPPPPPPPPNQQTFVWPTSGLSSRTLYAYSWPDYPSGYSSSNLPHIIPMSWIYGYTAGDQAGEQSWALSHTANHPSGQHTIFANNLTKLLFYNVADACKDTDGNTVQVTSNNDGLSSAYIPNGYNGVFGSAVSGTVVGPMPCLSWDAGRAQAQSWYNTFFSGYKSAGGQLENIIADTEYLQFVSAYNLNVTQYRCDQARASDPKSCPISWCEAIQASPGFPPAGFPSDLTDLKGTLCTATGPAFNTYLYKYDEFINDRIADYEKQALYDTASGYFSGLRMSDYDMFHWNSAYNVPLGSSAYYSYGNGAHVGTHQAFSSYGELASEANLAGAGLSGYSTNAFNAFRMGVNKVRSAKLSDGSPIHTWITEKVPDPSAIPSTMTNSDLYQEMLFHAVLNGTDQFAYWTAYTWSQGGYSNSQISSGMTIINSVLAEAQAMVGYQGATPLVTGLTPWYNNYVASGMLVGNYKIWRFTPNLSGQSLASVLVHDGDPGATTGSVLFSIGGVSVTFPNAFIYTPSGGSVSSQGYWIIESSSASPVLAYTMGAYLASTWNAFTSFLQSLANLLNM